MKLFKFNVERAVMYVLSIVILSWFVVLQQSEVATASNVGKVGHWKFDENSGSAVDDKSGNGNGGVLEYGAARTTGIFEGAIRFDGVNDRIHISTKGNLNNMSTFSVTGWIYARGYDSIILRKSSLSPAPFNIILNNSGHLTLRAGYTSRTGVWRMEQSLSLEEWHHFAVTYTRGDINADPVFYINGVLQNIDEIQTPSGNAVDDNGKIYIGNNISGASGFEGIIDSVRVYNRVLPLEDVLEIYNWEFSKAKPTAKPNIIVIMTDDQDDGPTMNKMEKVHRLIAKQGVTFENSFVDNSLCCPSRATFLTGQFSHNNGVFMIAPSTDLDADDTYTGGYSTLHPTADNTLPVWLQDASYTTAMIGKYINGYGLHVPGETIPPGWDKWFARVDGIEVNGVILHDGIKYFNYTVNDDGVMRTYGNSENDYITDVMTKEALEFINNQANSSKPFFIAFHPVTPHTEVDSRFGTIWIDFPKPAPRHEKAFSTEPLPQPPSFNEPWTNDKPTFMRDATNPLLTADDIDDLKALYRARLESLLSVDEAVEDIVNAVEAIGKLDNTVIVYTSDNGFFHGEHRRLHGKRLIYEESIRVPLIIRGPGIPQDATRSQMVNNVDLPATIVDLAQAIPGRTLDGRSLVSVLQKASQPWRTALLLQAGNKLSFLPFNDSTLYGIYRAVRTSNYVYAEHKLPYFGGFEYEFYDLRIDPYQLRSRHNDFQYDGIIKDLQEKLNLLRTCQGNNCFMTTPEIYP